MEVGIFGVLSLLWLCTSDHLTVDDVQYSIATLTTQKIQLSAHFLLRVGNMSRSSAIQFRTVSHRPFSNETIFERNRPCKGFSEERTWCKDTQALKGLIWIEFLTCTFTEPFHQVFH